MQTYIIGGDRGIRRTDPDYYALEVMNQILGGGPQARLFLDLREEHGYTYGAYRASARKTIRAIGCERRRAHAGDGRLDGAVSLRIQAHQRRTGAASELDDARRAIVAGFALSLEPAELLNYWLTPAFRPPGRLLGQIPRPHRRH